MKKLFMAFLAVATIAMVGCKKDDPTPTPTPTPGGGGDDPASEIPDIPAPAADKMILLVNVAKDINICNTIAMRGAMTNYGTDAPILFEKVEDYDNWYKAEMPAYTNADFFHCKLMIAAEDGTASYDNEGAAGQYELLNGADEYLLIDDDFGEANCLSMLNDVEVGGKILCVAIKGFKGNPCVAKTTYKITLKMAYAGDEYAPAVTGSFNSWAAAEPMNKVSDTEWNVEVEAQAGNEFKFQSTQGDWKNEIQVYDEENSEWKKMDNIKLDENLNPVFDFTDPAKYRWSKSVVKPVPAGNGKFTIKVTNRTYTTGDKCIFTGNFETESWGDSKREMTYVAADGVWTWEGDYPADFEFKVIYNDKWATGDNAKLYYEDEGGMEVLKGFTHEFEIAE